MAQSTPIRNPEKDHLLTPQNCVFVFIDYQPEQFTWVGSRPTEELILNILTLGKIAKEFSIPVVLSTVAVKKGINKPTISELRDMFPDAEEIDRMTLNSWEDEDFKAAVKATGRKKIVMSGLLTEICVAYPTLDAIEDDYEIYPVADAIAGVTKETHDIAMQRMIQAGAHPITALALACEIQRDWSRQDGDALRRIVRWYFSELRNNRYAYSSREAEKAAETLSYS